MRALSLSGLCLLLCTVLAAQISSASEIFRGAKSISVGNPGDSISSVVTADFNHDGNLDIAVALKTGTSGGAIQILLGNGKGAFTPLPELVLQGTPVAIALGDFDKNGSIDVAALVVHPSGGSSSSFSVGVLLGDGTGQLHPFAYYGIGNFFGSPKIVVGDFDGDTKVDLAIVGIPQLASQGKLTVLKGAGGGVFTSEPPIKLGADLPAGQYLVAADFKGDGKSELVIATTNDLEIRAANSAMQFEKVALSNNVVGSGFSDISVSTALVGSGRPSIVVAGGNQAGPGSVQVLRNIGNLSFTPEPQFSDGIPGATFVGSATFNSTSQASLFVFNSESNGLTLFPGVGVGAFGPNVIYSAAAHSGSPVVGDINNDGNSDILLPTTLPNCNANNVCKQPIIALYFGARGGSFYAAQLFATKQSPVALVTGDFNEDGALDVAVLESQVGGSDVELFSGDGKGGLVPLGSFRLPGFLPLAMAIGDFDLDGHQDLAVLDGQPGTRGLSIFFGNGKGSFVEGTTSYLSFAFPTAMKVGDFNHDGIPDIAIAEGGPVGQVYVYYGTGSRNSSFQPTAQRLSAGVNPAFLAAGNLAHVNGNDTHEGGNDFRPKTDLVVANCGGTACSPSGSNPNNGSVSVVLSGAHSFGNSFTSPGSAIAVAIADFNQDGNNDLAIASASSGSLSLEFGNGLGLFSTAAPIYAGSFGSTYDLESADFNGDGVPDLLAMAYSGGINSSPEIAVLTGNPGAQGTFNPPIIKRDVAPISRPGSPGSVGDFNGDGAPDFVTLARNGVVMLLNSGGSLLNASAPEDSIAANQTFSLTANISPTVPGAPLAVGTITFRDISTFPIGNLGSATVNAGLATITTSIAHPGTHVLEAAYSAGNLNPNSARVTVQVTAAGTSTTGGSENSGTPGSCSVPTTNIPVTSYRQLVAEGSSEILPSGTSSMAPAINEGTRGDASSLQERHRRETESFVFEGNAIHSQHLALSGPLDGFFGFDGLDAQDSRNADNNRQSTNEPPDEAIAVGNGQVLQAVNDALAVYAHTGKRISGPTALNPFFKLPDAEVYDNTGHTVDYGPFVSDPSVLYDPVLKRWVVTALRVNTDPTDGRFLQQAAIMIAVSSGSTALGPYQVYSVDITDSGFEDCPCISDQPLLGANADGIYVSTNQYSFTTGKFQSALILAIGKMNLLAGKTPLFGEGFQSLAQQEVPGFSIYPAKSAGPGISGVEYFLSTLDFDGVTGVEPLAARGDHRVTVWELSNTASLNTASPNLQLSEVTLASNAYAMPGPVSQESGVTPLLDALNQQNPYIHEKLEEIDANDDRMQQVYLANGTLYGAFNTRVGVPGSSDGIAWVAIKPEFTNCSLSAAIQQQGVLSVPGSSLMFPAIAVNSLGNGVLAFNVVSTKKHPSFGYVPISSTGVNQQAVSVVANGSAPEDGFTGYLGEGGDGIARWGDYSSATVAYDGSIWIAGEYITARPRPPLSIANWGTYIGRIPVK